MDGTNKIKENIVDLRIKKVLSSRIDNSYLLESLDTISEYILVNGNTITTRKTLRQDIELNNLQFNQIFLKEYYLFYQSIEQLQQSIHHIHQECHNISYNVIKANENMKLFINKATQLEEKRNLLLKQSLEIELFLKRFQLTSNEIQELSLTSSTSSSSSSSSSSTSYLGNEIDITIQLNENFFQILKKLRHAYNDCKEMVELHQYNAGYELLDLLGHHQDIGYQKLFEWIKQRCEINSTISSQFDTADDIMLQTALNYLKEVPSYFLQCQELVISSRRSLIVQRFVLAITQGQQSSSSISSSYKEERNHHPSSRGFEMHAYDPIRFIGDMLAWIHQAMASEKEFLRGIFGNNIQSFPINNSNDEESTPHPPSSSSISSTTSDPIPELLVRCLSGLGRPLKVRILQILENLRVDIANGLETLYSLCDLIQFYSETYSRILSLQNSIQNAINECFHECKKSFSILLKKYSEQISHYSQNLFTIDTLATSTTKDTCQLLNKIFVIYKSSMSLASHSYLQQSLHSSNTTPPPPLTPSTSTTPSPLSGAEGLTSPSMEYDISIHHILESIIHPLLQSCRVCGNTAFMNNNCEMAIFMLNNVSLVKLTLIHSSQDSVSCKMVTNEWITLLETEMTSWIKVLIQENSLQILQKSEMDQIIDLMEVLPSDMVASEQVGLTFERLTTILRQFYASLINFNENLLEQLQDPELREIIRKDTSIKLLEAYKLVYNTVSNPKNKYPNIQNLISHSIEEVSVLLGCPEYGK